MKFRTDFVTNSSSSGFCVLRVDLDDGSHISWEDEEYGWLFDCTHDKNALEQIKSIQELLDYLAGCYKNGGCEAEFRGECSDFIKEMKQIDDFGAIVSVSIKYNSESEEGAIEGEFEYDFTNGSFKDEHYEESFEGDWDEEEE